MIHNMFVNIGASLLPDPFCCCCWSPEEKECKEAAESGPVL